MLTAQFFFFLDFDFEKKCSKNNSDKSSQKEGRKNNKKYKHVAASLGSLKKKKKSKIFSFSKFFYFLWPPFRISYELRPVNTDKLERYYFFKFSWNCAKPGVSWPSTLFTQSFSFLGESSFAFFRGLILKKKNRI